MVGKVEPAGDPVVVYNMRVAGAHTFFVGKERWGFAVWVHNTSGACPVNHSPGAGRPPAPLPKPTWPRTAEEMDKIIGFPGKRVPDGPRTPGRGKVEWPVGKGKIVWEQHPYHPGAPVEHTGPHWHIDMPKPGGGRIHERYLPGDPIPGF